MCDTYNCGYLQQSTFYFNLVDFQSHTDRFPFPIFFTVKSPSVTQIGFSRKVHLKRAQCYAQIILSL